MEHNVLFYSKYCKTCNNFLILLNNELLINNFKVICMEEYVLPNNINPNIHPSMIIKNVNKMFNGDECFKWLQNIKYIKDKNKLEMKNKQNQNDPLKFTYNEMSGISDNFAYTNIDHATPKSYVSADESNHNKIFTAPEYKPLNISEQKKHISNLSSLRKKEDDIIKEHLSNNKFDS
jgi:hypothetical protein